MQIVKSALAAILALTAANSAVAQQTMAERYELDGAQVTVLTHPFLSDEELLTLRLVGQNRDALSLFVPEGSGYAAIAVAPSEGFVRAGMPVDSASAISGLPDLATARTSALEACNAARRAGPACEVVLEVAPR
ncbi:MAG: hypothetical protein ACK4NW_13250 [Roseinatronobacter sp.]